MKIYGIVYGYYRNGHLVYVGSTTRYGDTMGQVLSKRHRGHLSGGTVFDLALRKDEDGFTLDVLHELTGDMLYAVRDQVNQLESEIIRANRPKYNRTGTGRSRDEHVTEWPAWVEELRVKFAGGVAAL
jgi:hypothetical protein